MLLNEFVMNKIGHRSSVKFNKNLEIIPPDITFNLNICEILHI